MWRTFYAQRETRVLGTTCDMLNDIFAMECLALNIPILFKSAALAQPVRTAADSHRQINLKLLSVLKAEVKMTHVTIAPEPIAFLQLIEPEGNQMTGIRIFLFQHVMIVYWSKGVSRLLPPVVLL